MVIVSTKKELKAAIDSREPKIIAVGDLAKSIRSKSKRKKGLRIGGIALAIAGVALIPLTGGTSAGLTAMGLTIGSASVSVAELAIICGCVVASIGALKGAKVILKPDGSVEIEPKYR